MMPVTLASLGFAALLFGAFVVALFVGSLLLPGPIVRRCRPAPWQPANLQAQRPAADGGAGGLRGAGDLAQLFSLAVVHEYFWPLLVVANGFAVALMVALYLKGRRPGTGDAPCAICSTAPRSILPGWGST